MALVLSNTTAESAVKGALFEKISFFLVQRLPTRSHLIEAVLENGGTVVRLESQADYVVADHVRRDCPPGSVSYTFIEAAVRDGALPDPAAHRAGVPSGSLASTVGGAANKSLRTPFTTEDDVLLCQWVEDAVKKGESVKGNKMYRALAAENPRHTYHSWRDRYLKRWYDQAQPSQTEAEPSRLEATRGRIRPRSATTEPPKLTTPNVKEDDILMLFSNGQDILDIDPARVVEAWDNWAQSYPNLSAMEWQGLWENVVRPRYFQAQQRSRPPVIETADPLPATIIDPQLERGTRDESQSATTGKNNDSQLRNVRSERKRPPTVDELDVISGGHFKRSKGNFDSPSSYSVHVDEAHSLQERIRQMRQLVQSLPKNTKATSLQSSRTQLIGDNDPPLKAPATHLARNSLSVNRSSLRNSPTRRPTPGTSAAQSTTPATPTARAPAAVPTTPKGNATPIPSRVKSSPFKSNATSDGNRNHRTEDLGAGSFGNQKAAAETSVPDQATPILPLTLDNLARQQAQHRVAPTRACDLPEDDELEDRGGFIQYLQKTLQPFKAENKLSNVGPVNGEVDEDADEEASSDSESSEVIDLQIADPEGGWPSSLPGDEASNEQDVIQNQQTTTALTQASAAETVENDGTESSTSQELPSLSQLADKRIKARELNGANAVDPTELYRQNDRNKLFLTPENLSRSESDIDQEDILKSVSQMNSPEATRTALTDSQKVGLAETQTIDVDDLDTYISTLRLRMGYRESDIIDALKMTSMRPELAELALLEQKCGRGWPADVPGIWSAEEDAQIRSGNTSQIKMIREKVGWDELQARLEFLESYEKEEEDD